MDKQISEEVVVRGPVLVPVAWLFAILSSSVGLAFVIGVWVATIATTQNAQGKTIEEYGARKVARDLEIAQIKQDLITIKVIVSMAFPDEAKRAGRSPSGN